MGNVCCKSEDNETSVGTRKPIEDVLHSLYGDVELLFLSIGTNLKTIRYSRNFPDGARNNQQLVDSMSRNIGDVISRKIEHPVARYPVEKEVMDDWVNAYAEMDDINLGENKKYSNILREVMAYIANDDFKPIPKHLLYPDSSNNGKGEFQSISKNHHMISTEVERHDTTNENQRSSFGKGKENQKWDPF